MEKGISRIALIIFITIILVIGGIVTVFVVKNLNSKSNSVNTERVKEFEDKIDSSLYITYKKDNALYIVNEKGEEIKTEFENAVTGLIGKYFLVYKEVDSSKNEYFLIDVNGKVYKELGTVLDFKVDGDAEKGYYLFDEALYDAEFNKISPEGYEIDSHVYSYEGYFAFDNSQKQTVGLIDYKGNILCEYEDYEWIVFQDGKSDDGVLYALLSNENEGLIYECISKKEVYKVLLNNDVTTILDMNNKEILKLDEDDDYDWEAENGILEIKDGNTNEKIIFNFTTGKVQDDNEPLPKIWEITNNTYIFEENGKFGLKTDKKIVLEAKYIEIDFLPQNISNYLKSKGKNYVMVKEEDEYLHYKISIVDINNNNIVKELFINGNILMTDIIEGSFVLWYDRVKEKNCLYNLITDKQVELPEIKIYFSKLYDNYAKIEGSDGKQYYYNINVEKFFEHE